jgi:divalent metal cation (Fe/Co/Zn/Cd) transporter
MVIEALGAIIAAWLSRSLLLLAFGIDSIIELASALILLWRLRREEGESRDLSESETIEGKASRVAGWLLYALAFYVVIQALWSLSQRNSAETSIIGICIAVIAAVGMPLLARRKLQVASAIGSRALRVDAVETIACGYFAWVLLAGLLLNALLQWWWIDSVTSLLIVPLLFREAGEAVRGGSCCEGNS